MTEQISNKELAKELLEIGDVNSRHLGCLERDTISTAAERLAAMPDADNALSLLRIAGCPNASCAGGIIPHGPLPDGSWEPEQCQFCYEREMVLSETAQPQQPAPDKETIKRYCLEFLDFYVATYTDMIISEGPVSIPDPSGFYGLWMQQQSAEGGE